MINDFVIFIISHGRAENIVTMEALKKGNYSGPIKIIIDNTDKQTSAYFAKYGEDVIVFDKLEIAKTTDNGDNFENYRSTTHARNACFDIAEKLGYKYFLVLDDDYTNFAFKFNRNLDFASTVRIKNLNEVIEILLDYYKSAPFVSLAIGQGGDYIGGANGWNGEKVRTRRKAMNFFICSTERRFKFFSRLNEDVNTYITLGSRGDLFLSILQIALIQKQTQAGAGGMTEAYLQHGTYTKSFYSVMYHPSGVKISTLGPSNPRVHHQITWKNTVPKILRESVKHN